MRKNDIIKPSESVMAEVEKFWRKPLCPHCLKRGHKYGMRIFGHKTLGVRWRCPACGKYTKKEDVS